MISVEISVEPHYRNCKYLPGTVQRTWDSPPPHVIIEKEFKKWDEAKEFLIEVLDLKTDSQTIEQVCNNPENEYAQVEIELLERTGREFTSVSLSIEGQEE